MAGSSWQAGAHRSSKVALGVLIAIAMMAAMLFGMLGAAWAEGSLAATSIQTQDGEATPGITYAYNDGVNAKTATVTGFEGAASGNLVIPATVEEGGVTYTVIAIGDNAFKNQTGFTGALTMPATIEEIGNSAFEGCSGLTGNMVLPSNLKSIGAAAFKNCKSIEGTWSLPSGLTSLGSEAFYDCIGMSGAVTIPAGITVIPDYCFYLSGHYDGGSWTSVPRGHGVMGLNFAEGSQIESIGAHAFERNRNFTGGLTFPASLKTIGDYAFHDLGSRALDGYTHEYVDPVGTKGTLSLPAGITAIGECAFSSSNYGGNLVIPNATVTIGKEAFKHAGFDGSLTIPEGVTSIPESCFEECGFTGALQLPSTITTIGKYAFARCEELNGTLVIPSGVTEISDYAFAWFGTNGTIGTLTLPSGLKTIGAGAFAANYGGCFTGPLNIPDSVEAIGEAAFSGCTEFTSLKLPNNKNYTTIERSTFSSGSSYSYMKFQGSLTIPESVTTIGDRAFYYCGSFTGNLDLPDGITSIGKEAFHHCDWFTGTLDLPSNLKTIGNEAFYWCESFTGLSIPEGVETIGEKAFFGCGYMSGNLVIPESLQTIEAHTFQQFGNKSDVGVTLTIGSGVQSIGEQAFCNSGLIGTATIPDTVTSLEDSIFSGCSKLTGYSLPDTLTAVPTGMFSGCSNLGGNLIIPASATSIGRSAFYGCSKLTGPLDIPADVTSIGYSAFEGCSGLTGGLAIPNGVTRIESETFEGCSGLTGSITISSNVTYLGSSAFAGCSGFTGLLTIPSSVTSLDSSVFEGCSGLTALDMQQTASSLPSYLFRNCTNLAGDVVIPPTVTSLGSQVFEGCAHLTGTLTIPSGVTRVTDTSLKAAGFGVIVNNSNKEFDGQTITLGTVDYFEDASGAKVETIGTGTYTRKSNDAPIDISGATISDIPDQTYTGSYLEPPITVTLNGKTLTEGLEYTLSYSNNRYISSNAMVIVTGKGYNGYIGEVRKTFNIVLTNALFDITGSTVTAEAQTYTGKALTPAVVVTTPGGAVLNPTGFTVEYKNNVNAGTATITVTGLESAGFTGTATGTFKINPKKVTPAIALSKTSFVYNGKAQKPTVTVKIGSTKLATSNYSLTWASGCKNVGKYTVKAVGKGNYSFTTKALSFTIVPKGTALTGVVAAKKAFTAKWGKQATQTTGYEVQYALNAKFKSAKIATVKGAKVVSKKVIKLKSKKKYYVRVRTYKTVGSAKYCSAWSKASTVTVK